MHVFGHKPSEIRKAIAGFATSLVALILILPLVGLPGGVTVAVASLVAALTSVGVYLSKANVARVIDAADAIDFDIPEDLGFIRKLLDKFRKR